MVARDMSENTSGNSPLTVSELIGRIRQALRGSIGIVRVSGELSNVNRPASGHCYFTLKDDAAQIRCVMFRSDLQRLRFAPQDGMQVVITGQADVYQARGTLQIRAVFMRAAGEGALQKAFEELKRRLHAEGLFDPDHKLPLPEFPERIAVVTSGTGAAVRDFLNVLSRRYPLVEVLLCPVQVQGVGAADDIAAAIRILNEIGRRPHVGPIDVIIVGRGGGSAEDLWAFNEEILARAIFASEIPIVSAVGHETDFSIADFTADVRAPTPSAAAELVVPDRLELARHVRLLAAKARSIISGTISRRRQDVLHLLRSHGMMRPGERIVQLVMQVDELSERLDNGLSKALHQRTEKVNALRRQLDALSPLSTLERGYARVERAGQPVTRAADLVKGDDVTLRFADGSSSARILDD